MEINIDRHNGIPIYIQIKKQIKEMIKKGILTRGDRLPPERELAEKLKISRNRVSTAYKELENEKIIYSQQGKGTFIGGGQLKGVRETSRKDKILKIIDLAMEEALELGFSLDDFLTIAYVRAREKEDLLSKAKMAFVECNKEQLSTLINETEITHDVAKLSVLISEMREEPERVKNIFSRSEIVITTPFHLQEVEDFVSGMDINIIDMTLEPKMETIVQLARIDTETRVGLVCQSANFAKEVESSIENIGLNDFQFDYSLQEGEKLDDFLEKNDVIIASPHRYQEVTQRVKRNQKVIRFEYAPDQGSINMLKMTLMD